MRTKNEDKSYTKSENNKKKKAILHFKFGSRFSGNLNAKYKICLIMLNSKEDNISDSYI